MRKHPTSSMRFNANIPLRFFADFNEIFTIFADIINNPQLFTQFLLNFRFFKSFSEHIINHRANAKNGDVSDPGTVEQRVFLHLNGPPAGSSLNVKFLNRALIIMYKGDVSRHFTHSQRYLRFSSKVTARIHDSQNSLPCYKD